MGDEEINRQQGDVVGESTEVREGKRATSDEIRIGNLRDFYKFAAGNIHCHEISSFSAPTIDEDEVSEKVLLLKLR